MWGGMVRRKLRERKKSYAGENPVDNLRQQQRQDPPGPFLLAPDGARRVGHPQKLQKQRHELLA